MLSEVLSAAGAIQTVLSVGTLGVLLLSALRSARSDDRRDRAGLRSMSWPAVGKN
jgi:hypothetical protein